MPLLLYEVKIAAASSVHLSGIRNVLDLSPGRLSYGTNGRGLGDGGIRWPHYAAVEGRDLSMSSV